MFVVDGSIKNDENLLFKIVSWTANLYLNKLLIWINHSKFPVEEKTATKCKISSEKLLENEKFRVVKYGEIT